ncbi:MAG: hypothetical protein U9P38_07195, partial [Campylobacterota bacterium]|nr:hypothetical protein [Campylobacterota bacterium]
KNSCRCVLRSGLAEKIEFENQEEAKKEAQSMIEMMKSTFCQKHEFVLQEQFGDFTIYIKPRS